MTKISDIDPKISEWHDEWKRNRDIIEGERAVTRKGCNDYLPRGALDEAQYRAIIARTPFTPAAARTHEGLLGLIFRKPATIEAPDSVSTILETITPDYLTVDDLAEEVASEFLITNFVGLLVDLPVTAPGTLTRKESEALGVRPTVAVYRAESILGVEPGVVKGGRAIVRVRLQDDPNTIRELWLDGGAYTVTMWRRDSDGADYVADEPIRPLRAGKPIVGEGLPFTLVSTNRRYAPAKPKMSDVCRLNVHHFIASSNLAQCDFFSSNPTPFLFGPAKVAKLTLAPGAFIQGEVKSGNDIRIGMLEYTGAAMQALAARKTEIANDMAKVGSRILAEEKASVESSETLRVRAASENATLASAARLISRKITDALKWVAYWLELEEGSISYEANTDYGSAPLDKDQTATLLALYQADVISKDAFLDALIEGEVLPESFDKEADAQKIAEEVADRPPAIVIPDSGVDPTA